MKVLVELLVIVLLIMCGWRQSFREHASRLFPNAPFANEQRIPLGIPPPPVVAYPQSPPVSEGNSRTAARENSWLWDKTPLDRQ